MQYHHELFLKFKLAVEALFRGSNLVDKDIQSFIHNEWRRINGNCPEADTRIKMKAVNKYLVDGNLFQDYQKLFKEIKMEYNRN